MFRKILFWTHLIAGCTAGVVILLMSLTGVLLMFERQMIARGERGPFRADPPAHGARLPMDEMLDAAAKQRPLPASATLTIRSDPREPAEIRAPRQRAIYLSPYTGRVLGQESGETAAFFQSLRTWHRWLGVPADSPHRARAKAFTGASNLLFLFIVISGAYLWLPRVWSMRHLRPIAWFKGGLSGKPRDFNWHNVFGIWSFIPLFFIVLSAIPISYTWGGALIYTITGVTPPSPAKAPAQPPAEPEKPPAPTAAPSLDRLWTRAASQVPEWRSLSAPLRPAPGPVTFSIDTGDGGQPQRKSTLTLDPASAAVLRFETFADGDAARRLRGYSRFLHTGEVLGLPGQTIAGIASFGGVMLGWTGISLALRRLAAWNRRR